MVLFAAIPRSALIWARNVMVQPLEVANESPTASGPTTGSARSTDDAPNRVEPRRRAPIQTDVAGRARVIDGDTLEVGSVRIRLFGLDAPESAQRCLAGSRRWPCGEKATRALVGRIDGRSVACEERDKDRYGRIVAVCRYGGQDVNAWLVREGWAMAYRRYSSAYAGEEASAKAAKRGVWRGEFVPPWDWRRGDRLKSASRGHRVKATRDAPASPQVIESTATSRGTSATTAGSASTTCPAIVTMIARASAPRAVSGTSAAKPKRGRLDGVARAGDRTPQATPGREFYADNAGFPVYDRCSRPWRGHPEEPSCPSCLASPVDILRPAANTTAWVLWSLQWDRRQMAAGNRSD